MKLSDWKAQCEARNKADLAASPVSEACELAAMATLADAIRIQDGSLTRPAAVDPTFWLTIVQLLAPIILEWINRRFPRPTTPTA